MISGDDIAAFEEDDATLDRVLTRRARGAVEHRRIFADEEDAVLNMAMHYKARCFQLVRELQRMGLDAMEPHRDPARTRGRHEGPFGQGGTG